MSLATVVVVVWGADDDGAVGAGGGVNPVVDGTLSC